MSKTVKLDLPSNIPAWRQTVERARDIYWGARAKGKDENGALTEVVDDILAAADEGRHSR